MDFTGVLTERKVCGVGLTYTEFDFIQFEDSGIVLFDAYSTAHKYKAFDAECGMIAFPFYCGAETEDGERVAYAGLRFDEKPASKWVPLFARDTQSKLAADPDAGGVPITSGVCCFSDERGYGEYISHIKDEIHPLAGLIVLDGQTHGRVELFGRAYAVFSAGWGDGQYSCYRGIDENGKTVAVIADFGMIEYPKDRTELIDTEIEIEETAYFYDRKKSESQNNAERWTRIIEHSEDPAELLKAYSRRGYAYHSMNEIDKALEDYLSAVECSKKTTDRTAHTRAWSVYDNAAEIFCERNDYDSAIRLMTDALNVRDSFYTGAYIRLIDLYQTVKRTDKATEIARRMLKLRPDDPVAYVKYAECCVAAMDYGSAAEAYGRLASQFKLYENLFDQASCLIESGEYEKADSALESHPAKEFYEQYFYYKAYIDYKRHRFHSALELAEKSHELDREYMPALYLLIDIHSLLNEYRAVAVYAEEYKKLRPDNEYGFSVCADAHLILGNISESAKNYCYLYEKIKSDDRYAALAAVLCAQSGDSAKSGALLRKLKKIKSDYYNVASHVVGILKHSRRYFSVDRIVSDVSDDELLIMLSVFLLRTNNVAQATQVLETLLKSEDPGYETVAQQIRIAEKIGDKKHFLSFLNYYIDKFISKKVPYSERAAIGRRFLNGTRKRENWLDVFYERT